MYVRTVVIFGTFILQLATNKSYRVWQEKFKYQYLDHVLIRINDMCNTYKKPQTFCRFPSFPEERISCTQDYHECDKSRKNYSYRGFKGKVILLIVYVFS